MLSTITSKGQVTIPKPLRDQLNLTLHDKVDFSIDGDQIILRPVKTLRDLRGCIQRARVIQRLNGLPLRRRWQVESWMKFRCFLFTCGLN